METHKSTYKFRINKSTEGYAFVLYPNNNNRQPIGQSPDYPTEQACRAALDEFRALVKNQHIVSVPHPAVNLLEVELSEGVSRYYVTYLNNGRMVFETRKYFQKAHSEEMVQNIFCHIDDPLLP